MTRNPVRYSDDVEQVGPDEEDQIADTIDLMRSTMEQTFEQHRHATSGTHAKSHGIAVGTLTVHDDLPTELAQGLFAGPGSYEALVRLASEPGQVDPDTATRARGLALKVLDVPGDKLEPGWPSHDILFNTWPVIPEGDVATYLDAIRSREEHAGHHLRTVLKTTLRNPDPQGLLFERTPNISPVAHTYYSQAAFRHGDHIAKYRLLPATDEMRALAERTVDRSDPPGVLRDWTQEFFASSTARWELGVQLCTDLVTMPVEDASVEWPEDESPYVTVATLELPPQETFSPARRTWAEDVAAWRPWNGLVAHRPLGSINRVRRRAYDELGAWRHRMNAVTPAEPTSLADIPS